MKNLIITLFVIGFAELILQDIRHVQVYLTKDERPALFEFRKDKIEVVNAESALSIEELKLKLTNVNSEIDKLESGKNDKEIKEQKESHEIYKRQGAIEREIVDRVGKSREIRDLWIFCGAGLILIGVGSWVFYRKRNWVALTIIISGYTEIIYWSSPSLFYGGAFAEHSLLLENKIIITSIALCVLLFSFIKYNRENS